VNDFNKLGHYATQSPTSLLSFGFSAFHGGVEEDYMALVDLTPLLPQPIADRLIPTQIAHVAFHYDLDPFDRAILCRLLPIASKRIASGDKTWDRYALTVTLALHNEQYLKPDVLTLIHQLGLQEDIADWMDALEKWETQTGFAFAGFSASGLGTEMLKVHGVRFEEVLIKTASQVFGQAPVTQESLDEMKAMFPGETRTPSEMRLYRHHLRKWLALPVTYRDQFPQQSA
jgi:hypothetical protein